MQSFNHLERKRKNLLKRRRRKMKMNTLTFHQGKKTNMKNLRLLKRNLTWRGKKEKKRHKRWLMFSHQKRLVY